MNRKLATRLAGWNTVEDIMKKLRVNAVLSKTLILVYLNTFKSIISC
jgi:hypothetical protein